MSVIPMSVTRKFHRQVLVTKKHSPHIFFATGMLGAVVSTVLACRATLKLSETLDEIQNDISSVKTLSHSTNDIKEMPEGVTVQEIIRNSEYPEDQYGRDLMYVYAKACFRIGKLYGPSIIVGAASVGLLTGSHVQLHRRNQALMAAYGLLQQAFNEYRERIREELGEEREQELYLGIVDETIVNELGKKENIKALGPHGYSMHAKIFEATNPNWERDPEYNRMFIQIQESIANQMLLANGHLFLNQVYHMLGFDDTRQGAIVGWIISKDTPCYFDFKMFDILDRPEKVDFINGREHSIILDFNVDGIIYNLI